jgi:hypothetical protein
MARLGAMRGDDDGEPDEELPPPVRRVPAERPENERPNFDAMREEARRRYGTGPGLYPLLLLQDDYLVDAGYTPMSPYWRWSLREFFRALEEYRKRWGIWLAGRGMGKSTTLTRVAAAAGIWVPRSVPPTQRWVCPFISVRPTDADTRLGEIGGILSDAYGAVGVDAKGKTVLPEITAPRSVPTIKLADANDQAIAYNSLASTIGNVKGPNIFCVIFDEEAAMRHAGSNPSGEILASIIGAFRAREGVFGIRCSSAWEREGSHWNAVEAGDTVTNFVATIGKDFVDIAASGFLDVADWEEKRGAGREAARKIRAYVDTLEAGSRGIPTWVGNPTIGAVASRVDIEALDDKTLGALYPGLTRDAAWLREFGSVPPHPLGSARGAPWCAGLAERNRALNDVAAGRNERRMLGAGEPRATGKRRTKTAGARLRTI